MKKTQNICKWLSTTVLTKQSRFYFHNFKDQISNQKIVLVDNIPNNMFEFKNYIVKQIIGNILDSLGNFITTQY